MIHAQSVSPIRCIRLGDNVRPSSPNPSIPVIHFQIWCTEHYTKLRNFTQHAKLIVINAGLWLFMVHDLNKAIICSTVCTILPFLPISAFRSEIFHIRIATTMRRLKIALGMWHGSPCLGCGFRDVTEYIVPKMCLWACSLRTNVSRWGGGGGFRSLSIFEPPYPSFPPAGKEKSLRARGSITFIHHGSILWNRKARNLFDSSRYYLEIFRQSIKSYIILAHF